MMSKLQSIVWAAAMLATMPVTNAAERADADRLAACAEERDEARRLACYDEAISASRKSSDSEPAVAAPAKPAAAERAAPKATPAPAAAAADPASEFGVTGSAIARQRRAEEEQQASGNGKIESLSAQITEVSSRPRGELVMTLDNGQVWAQKKVERHFMAKPGDNITINAGMLGSYRMVNGKRSTQVTRLK
ncbi:hypothetical protein JM946_02155 [Steroidobacter sp. S1-65]|uniref:Uncharacterized protein n=1 Tax=Steroidobacter gossypii TaxID=2805490 RepID=A0ABS1WRE5_9GAMM|nr:hypothetical protein [Steroidobacter gossypii]MBM0103523.1 hypothetical protein [Steroidobacter gossypii]